MSNILLYDALYKAGQANGYFEHKMRMYSNPKYDPDRYKLLYLHTLQLKRLMDLLSWEDQIRFCHFCQYGEKMLHFLDSEQQSAYRLLS